MSFDLVIPVGPQHYNFFKNNIKQIVYNINPNRVVIITNSSIIQGAEKKYRDYTFIDENKVIDELTIDIIKEYLNKRIGNEERAGWYFQQFLKMGYSLKHSSSNYLVWDSDTLSHHKLTFFDQEKILFSYSEEFYTPYFKTMEKLLGFGKSFGKSFITEHMMFNAKIMVELISHIQKIDTSKSWFFNVLDTIDNDNLGKAGFSEYETYGTFMFHNYKSSYYPRYIWHNRRDSKKIAFRIFKPLVSRIFDTSSYEEWQNISLKDYLLNCRNTKILKSTFREIQW